MNYVLVAHKKKGGALPLLPGHDSDDADFRGVDGKGVAALVDRRVGGLLYLNSDGFPVYFFCLG